MKTEELMNKYCELNPGLENDYGTLMYTVGEEEMCGVLEKCIIENKRFQICYPKDTDDGGYIRYLNK
ncbi:hypothetical protein N9S47_01665 [Flavobacteriaceae bacterium]|nr:hypothetical protein [Flavobacteriaceae bacterium]